MSGIKLIYKSILAIFFCAFFGWFVLLQSQNRRGAILALMILLLIIVEALRQKKENRENIFVKKIFSQRYFEWKAFIVTFLVRFFYCSYMGQYIRQVSDFAVLFEEAKSGVFKDNLRYYQRSPHKMFYPLLLHFLGLVTQKRVLLFQCFCLGITAVIIYRIGVELYGHKAGVFAAVLYAFWPAQIAYTQITTEEHIASLFVALLLWTLLRLKKSLDENIRVERFLLLSVFAGILFGVTALLKDWGLVFLVAILICSVYLMLEYKNKRKIFLLLSSIVIMILVRTGIQKAAMFAGKQILGVQPQNNIIFMQLYETMDPECLGGYDEKRVKQYITMLENNDYDFDAANKEAMNILLGRIKEYPEKMPRLLLRKGTEAYVNDSAIFWWTFIAETEHAPAWKFYSIREKFEFVDRIYYCFIVLLMMLSVFIVEKKENFFILLTILGSGLISLLVESQGRYKYSIEPLWCIPAAVALCTLVKVKEKRV